MTKFFKNILFDVFSKLFNISEVIVVNELKKDLPSDEVIIFSSIIEFKKFLEIKAHLAIFANG